MNKTNQDIIARLKTYRQRIKDNVSGKDSRLDLIDETIDHLEDGGSSSIEDLQKEKGRILKDIDSLQKRSEKLDIYTRCLNLNKECLDIVTFRQVDLAAHELWKYHFDNTTHSENKKQFTRHEIAEQKRKVDLSDTLRKEMRSKGQMTITAAEIKARGMQFLLDEIEDHREENFSTYLDKREDIYADKYDMWDSLNVSDLQDILSQIDEKIKENQKSKSIGDGKNLDDLDDEYYELKEKQKLLRLTIADMKGRGKDELFIHDARMCNLDILIDEFISKNDENIQRNNGEGMLL